MFEDADEKGFVGGVVPPSSGRFPVSGRNVETGLGPFTVGENLFRRFSYHFLTKVVKEAYAEKDPEIEESR